MSWKTMAARRMGRLCVTVHTAAVPSEPDWDRYMAGVDAYLPLSDQRVLVVSAGGGPNGKQRKMMIRALDGAVVPVAILTNSTLMRGAGIAISWFNPSLKVLGPHSLQAAFDYLGLTTWERTESEITIAEMQRDLGVRVMSLGNAAGF